MNAWEKVSRDERIQELHVARYEALGRLIGVVDSVMLAEENPTLFNMTDMLRKLREARKAYDVAVTAYLNARLGAI
jgi:hypothetical protein